MWGGRVGVKRRWCHGSPRHGRWGQGPGRRGGRGSGFGRRQGERAFLRGVAEPSCRASLIAHPQDDGLPAAVAHPDRNQKAMVVDGHEALGLAPRNPRRPPEGDPCSGWGERPQADFVAVEVVALGDAPAKDDAPGGDPSPLQAVGPGRGKKRVRVASGGEEGPENRRPGERAEREGKRDQEAGETGRASGTSWRVSFTCRATTGPGAGGPVLCAHGGGVWRERELHVVSWGCAGAKGRVGGLPGGSMGGESPNRGPERRGKPRPRDR